MISSSFKVWIWLSIKKHLKSFFNLKPNFLSSWFTYLLLSSSDGFLFAFSRSLYAQWVNTMHVLSRKLPPNISVNNLSMIYTFWSNLVFWPLRTIRKAWTSFYFFNSATIAAICLVSSPLVSKRPGVSKNLASLSSVPLQGSSNDSDIVVTECKSAPTLNFSSFPHKVFKVELFPAPVYPITTTVLV